MRTVPTLIAVAAAVSATLVAPSAHAEDPSADHRPCVANREYAGAEGGAGRTVIERNWEVTGLGQRLSFFGNDLVVYPWCDHPSNLGDTSKAWIGVAYNADRKALSYWKWSCEWNEPFGCNPPPPPPVDDPEPQPQPSDEPCTVKCPPPYH